MTTITFHTSIKRKNKSPTGMSESLLRAFKLPIPYDPFPYHLPVQESAELCKLASAFRLPAWPKVPVGYLRSCLDHKRLKGPMGLGESFLYGLSALCGLVTWVCHLHTHTEAGRQGEESGAGRRCAVTWCQYLCTDVGLACLKTNCSLRSRG